MNLDKFFSKHGKCKYAFKMIYSEFKEAKHALKEGWLPTHDVIPDTVDDKEFLQLYEEHIKDTFPDELASGGVKLMDFADSCSYNLHDYMNMYDRYCKLKNGESKAAVTVVRPNIRYGML